MAPAAVVQVQITVELLEKLAGIRPKPSAKQQQQQLQQRQKQQKQQLQHLQPGRYVELTKVSQLSLQRCCCQEHH